MLKKIFERLKLKPEMVLPIFALAFIAIIVGFAIFPEETRAVLLLAALLLFAGIPVIIATWIRGEHVRTLLTMEGLKRTGILLVVLVFIALSSSLIVSAAFPMAVPLLSNAFCPIGFSGAHTFQKDREITKIENRVEQTYIQKETCIVCEGHRYEYTVDSVPVIGGMMLMHLSLSFLVVISGAVAAFLIKSGKRVFKALIPLVVFLLSTGLFLVPSPVAAALQGAYRFLFYGQSTPLFYSAVSDNNPELADYLMAQGASVNSVRNGETPLMFAVRKGRTSMVEHIISRGADIEIRDSDGLTPLMRAVQNKDVEIVGLLLMNDADVNSRSNSGESVLSMAQKAGNEKVLELVLRREPRSE
ncbi:MAG: ankyrin repeat domain-containing protein [Spirochaetaceae bacterium]|nr:MAG: ankyrin repeat domain-containing protein [Spirochaetaceae bacterium]